MPSRLTRGTRVGDRYRLERELGRSTDGITWEAVDERLDRRVALRVFDPSLDRKTIVNRAGLAASLTHPRVVRLFDTGEHSGRFFTVSELVGESLSSAALPLPSDVALRIAIDVAEALGYAHERGVVHGNLQENNVLLSEGGAKVGDFALGSRSEHADRDDDLRSLGAMMRRVAHVPSPGGTPGFARVIEGLATGAYDSATVALRDLSALRPPPPAPPRPASRRGWLLIVAAVIVAVAVAGVTQLGERSPSQRLIPGGRIEGTPLPVAAAADHDPLGDQRESPRTVGNTVDGDPQTFWTTEAYRGGPDFSGLKEGVGVIVDIGEATDVGAAQLLFVAQGCSFDLRYSDDPNAPVAQWETAARIEDSPVSAPIEFTSARARYWLVWLTRLTQQGNVFTCGIREIELFEP